MGWKMDIHVNCFQKVWQCNNQYHPYPTMHRIGCKIYLYWLHRWCWRPSDVLGSKCSNVREGKSPHHNTWQREIHWDVVWRDTWRKDDGEGDWGKCLWRALGSVAGKANSTFKLFDNLDSNVVSIAQVQHPELFLVKRFSPSSTSPPPPPHYSSYCWPLRDFSCEMSGW